MKVTLIYAPEERELILAKWAIWVTQGKTEKPKKRISSGLLYKVLRARHSPVRVLNFAFLVEGIPSNTATHFCRHVHAVPFVNSLRNRAAAKTREVAKMMCNEAIKAMPELNGLLEPMCVYHGGVCHKIEGCGRCIHG